MSFVRLLSRSFFIVTIVLVVTPDAMTFGQSFSEPSTFTLTDRESSDFMLAKYSVDRFESPDYSYANTFKHRKQQRKALSFSQDLEKMMAEIMRVKKVKK